MSSNGSTATVGDAENSLEKIKRQLASGSGKNVLQGPLLKRSETLRKWNERWMILDPTTGKMEYKAKRSETVIKGTIIFDSTSVINLCPLNFHYLPKYDGCCFYVGTPHKREYFLCAETPGAARAWVSTLHATQLVLRAHKEAVNSLSASGNGPAKMGTVATVLAAANSAALEASKEIEVAMQVSMRAALSKISHKSNDDEMDDLAIMKETLRVKDEELQHLAKDIRARNSTIKEIADKLTDTAVAAEAAASAAHVMDEERRLACAELERLKKDTEKQLETLTQKLKESDEKVVALNQEKELVLKQRDDALQEAHIWRSELGKARERAVILEAAVLRADERARVAQADAEAKLKDSAEKELVAAKEKEELLAYATYLQSQMQRQESNTKQVINGSESCSDSGRSVPLTKHVDLSDDNVDKACVNDSRDLPDSSDGVIQLAVDRVDIRSIGDSGWSDFLQTTDDRIDDVREISPEDRNSLDIPVVSQADDRHQHGGSSLQP